MSLRLSDFGKSTAKYGDVHTQRRIVIRVPMPPVPKARARMGKNGHWYTPEATAQAERDIAVMALASMAGTAPLRSGVSVEIRFNMPIPPSWSKKRHEKMELKYHTVKPDLDNLVKTVKDALNGIVWLDDAQVCALEASKSYSPDPGTEITITEA